MATFNSILIGNTPCSQAYIGTSPIFTRKESIVNNVAMAYLNRGAYNNNDYSYTYITDYYQIPTDYRKDQPNGKYINWAGSSINGYTVMYSVNSDYSEYLSVDVSGNYITLYNLLPQTYYYKVIDKDNGNVVKEDTFMLEGPLKMVKVDSVMNVRDLGGWNIEGVGRVKYGKLIRGGEFDNSTEVTISQADISTLRNIIGITAEIDFRSSAESYLKTKSALGDDISFFRRATDNYVKSVSPDNNGAPYLTQNAIKKIIEWLVAGKCVYLHCQGGADRTGMVAMLIEAMLGVSESDCCKDWEITSFSSYGLRQRDSNSYNYKGTIEYLKTYSGSTFQEKVINWAKTNFPNEYGFQPLTDSEITALQNAMIE